MTAKLLRQFILISITPMLFAISGSVSANQTTPQKEGATTTTMTKDQSDRYDAAMKRCDAMTGNDKTQCEKEVKSEHKAAGASSDNAYNAAKEKCDTLSGDAKDKCMTEAKTKHGK